MFINEYSLSFLLSILDIRYVTKLSAWPLIWKIMIYLWIYIIMEKSLEILNLLMQHWRERNKSFIQVLNPQVLL